MKDQPTLIPQPATMTAAEYRDAKKIIKDGLSTFIAVGNALIAIRHGRGYVFDHYQTFEQFLKGEFDIGGSRGYQLVDGARTVAAISTIVDIIPKNEGQARALVPLLPIDPDKDPNAAGRPIEWRPDTTDHLIDTWRDVASRATKDKPITASVIKAAVKTKLEEIRPEQGTPDLPDGIFSTIVADPPWPIQKIERETVPNQHVIDYPTMTLEAIADLNIEARAADDAHLYLWTTQKHLPNAFAIAEAWGFKYQCLMTWVKNVGFTPFSWMYSTEHVLFCRRGNLPLLRNGLRLDFAAPRGDHSVKPDVFYERVIEASPGPRLELFGRKDREGFTVWGNDPAVTDG